MNEASKEKNEKILHFGHKKIIGMQPYGRGAPGANPLDLLVNTMDSAK